MELLGPAVDLREVLAEAIGDVTAKYGLRPGSSPAATVAIVRCTSERVEGLVLGDSPIVVFGQDGGVDGCVMGAMTSWSRSCVTGRVSNVGSKPVTGKNSRP